MRCPTRDTLKAMSACEIYYCDILTSSSALSRDSKPTSPESYFSTSAPVTPKETSHKYANYSAPSIPQPRKPLSQSTHTHLYQPSPSFSSPEGSRDSLRSQWLGHRASCKATKRMEPSCRIRKRLLPTRLHSLCPIRWVGIDKRARR